MRNVLNCILIAIAVVCLSMKHIDFMNYYIALSCCAIIAAVAIRDVIRQNKG